MKLNRDYPVYVFDTSGLLDLAFQRTVRHKELLGILDPDGQYFYHPITLAEITSYFHPEIWKERNLGYNSGQIRKKISKRRLLVSILYTHRKRSASVQHIHGKRFLPFLPSFEMFSFMAHQCSLPANLCKLPAGKITVVANMTDHQILTVACFINRSRKYDVKFVSADKVQLAAADHLGVPWVYTRDPDRTSPFPWIACY